MSTVAEGRRGGRGARRAERMSMKVTSLPTLKRQIPLYEVLNAEGLEMIHDASCRILEEIGIDFRDAEALALWKDAGADVRGERVHIPRQLLMSLIDHVPGQFTLTARNTERSVTVGGDNMIFLPTYGSPFVRMEDDVRRYGTMDDLQRFHRLAYMSPAIHNTGLVICEPTDIPVAKRHLHIVRSLITNSDKSFMGPVTAPERAQDAVDMAGILFGESFVHDNPVMVSLANCNSPLVWDETMLGALKVYARAGQPVICAPFTLAGANTPASAVATVAELNAEAVSALAFSQLVRPGCPMVYGHFLAAVSMKSGAPMAGTSELALMNLMIGQLARKYKVPFRSSGMLTGSKVTDAQAGYESAFNMFPIMLAGANLIMHTAGWTEAGLCASLAKFALDAEQMEMLYKFAQGPQFGDFDEAVASIRDVGPGGHFLGTAHTQANFQSAFFMPELMDNNSFEQWQIEGEKSAQARGIEAAQKKLAAFEPPPIDPAVVEALDAFIAKREATLPDHLN
ncbi:MAG TPA: trimethylamine methyltransferase family protein [Geminicoccus sp.]|uniref:trimethylamine methyltransferase family protein n=1 Tax=Geminicoccus sp. TaxID=2024832 RepID=UPI002E321E1C|nr:trimethylamine methyltransferase family protein [Geminicoccus sp.]HEX2524861.1 trimethylamine methyltransferase family protein [Geminicoccus sp.]